MLLVVPPVSVVLGTTDVCVGSLAVAFVVKPLTLVDVAISMMEGSGAACMVKLPLANILSPIRPLHRSLSVPQPTLPLALIHSTSLVGVHSEDHFIGVIELAFQRLP